METKELPIQQAKEGEEYSNEVVYKGDEFQKKMQIYGINDLLDNKLAIKQDKEKYIFAINGENKFAVSTKANLEDFINNFYQNIANKEQEITKKNVRIRVYEFEKKTKVEIITIQTNEELDELKSDITIGTIKYKIDRLITFFEQEKSLADSETSGWIFNRKYDRKDKGIRKIHKTEIDRRLKELKKIKQQIEQIEKNKQKTYKNNVKMDDINEFDMNMTLKQFNSRIEELGKEAPDFILTRNDIILEKGDTVPYYELIIHDRKDAKKLSKSLKKINNEYVILNKLELTAAKRQELSQDLQDLEEYLNKVIDGPDTFKPSEHPFIPKHAKEFQELAKIDPTLAAFMKMNKQTGKTSIDKNNKDTNNEGNIGNQDNRKKVSEYMSSPYNSAGEAFEKGGIEGMIKHGLDQSNMSCKQKQFWGGVGNLAVTGGLIFVGWKMIKSAWNLLTGKNKGDDKKDARRADLAWFLGPIALIFASNARTGEGPLKLLTGGENTRRISKIRGGGDSGENINTNSSQNPENGSGNTIVNTNNTNEPSQDTELRIRYKEGFVGATALFNGLKYEDMNKFLIQENGHMKIDPTKYDELLEIFKKGEKPNEAAASFLEYVGKNDDKHIIDLALDSMGITLKEIQDPNNKDKTFNKAASEAIVRLVSVGHFMDGDNKNKEQYKMINPETTDLVVQYIRNGKKGDLEKLAARGDVFYKEIEITDKTGLKDKIKEIANGDKTREEALLLAINTFYNYMPNADKEIDLNGTRPEITFTTYGQNTKLNLDPEKKSLVGFTPKGFSSYFELFKAANLTNDIQNICKDKISMKKDPFYSMSLMGIYFNDSAVLSTDTDTRVVTKGSLETTSPTLEKYPKEYLAYLNGLRDRKVKPEKKEKLDTIPSNILTAITTITAGKSQQADIILGLKRFYTNRQNDERGTLEITGGWPKMQFRTYGKSVTLNLEDISLVSFGARFNTNKESAKNYTELFKAANLTNYIEMIAGDKIPNKNYAGAPFDVGKTGNIVFNDEGTRSLETDTKILSAGRFGTLGKTSKTLETNKDSYVGYLNTLWDKSGLRNKVRTLVKGDDQRERDIIAGLNTFHDQMPNNEKKIDLKNLNRPYADFETYGETTTINMQTKGIKNFTACAFDDYLEVFKVASLTNAIKHVFKNRTASNIPFNKSFFGGDIEFDRNMTFESGFPRWKGVRDVEAISAGRWGNLGKISPKLEEHKQAYIDYLNSLKFWNVKPNLYSKAFEPREKQ